jgi:hypothetical protein
MKYFPKIFLILLLARLAYPQEIADTLENYPESGLENYPVSFESLRKIENRFNEFDLLRELHYINKTEVLNNDPQTAMLWTSYILSGSSSLRWRTADEKPGHLTSVLYDQYMEDSKFNAVKYVLGAAQLSAVGYLAYLHIKKYGFLK